MKLKKFGGTEQKIYDLVKPITDELGYYLWDVCYVKEGAAWYLRIFIDCDEGITIGDCEKVTEPVNKLLDEKDPILRGRQGTHSLHKKYRRRKGDRRLPQRRG